jgi:catalase
MNSLLAAIKKEGAAAAIIAPKVGGVADSEGKKTPAQGALAGSPSVVFDAVAILSGADGDKALSADPDALGFLMDACRHLKAIAVSGVPALSARAAVGGRAGVVELRAARDIPQFIEFAKQGKVWERDR